MDLVYTLHKEQIPIIATAIHQGHRLAVPLMDYMHLQEHERFREEDPYTGYMANLPVSRVLVETSRFQVDLNRRRELAVYRKPEDAWGLTVWRPSLPELMVERLLQGYDRFYRDIDQLLQWTLALFGKFVVLDIHSYNHRRMHPDKPANTGENPEINIGTAHNHEKWKPLGHCLTSFLAHHRFEGRLLDVRENVKFKGGGFSEWINRNYGEYGCVFSLEFKKTFMDEWTGWVDIQHLNYIQTMLAGCVPFLMHMLDIPAKTSIFHGH
ncbi:N-formylglutamate amidohydrolase [Parapedobacter sp. GCM10030251]|uniref:N-formylglutamate amidohydrolase n=1 Tax=Parapedobacter sp. GCM10030251 TaxID=3273419 RepID=UPI003622296E